MGKVRPLRVSKPRPLARTLFDALVLVALLAMVGLALRQSGLLPVAPGTYLAIDGDSLRKDGEDFRLHGIDAPELHQACQTGNGQIYPCGQEARNALRRLVSQQLLDCRMRDVDRYGRSVVTCKAGDLDINAEMVRLGWAIAYRRHGLGYVREETTAHVASRGLWQGRFENPEAWRARHRGGPVRGSAIPAATPDG